MFSFGSQNNPMKWILWPSLFSTWGNWGWERFHNFPKSTQNGDSNLDLWHQSLGSSHVPHWLGISHHHLRTSHLLSHLSRKTKTLPTGQVQEEMCRLVFSLPAGVHRSVSISGPEARPSERSQGPCGNQFISFYSLLSTTFSMVSLKALGKKRVCCLVSVLKGSWLGRGD